MTEQQPIYPKHDDRDDDDGLNWPRITGITLAIAVHVAALLLLLAPVAPPGGAEDDDDVTRVVIIEPPPPPRSEEHTSELQSLMRISYAVFCLKKKKKKTKH